LKYVVDSNVLIVASGRGTHLGISEQLKAAQFLRKLMQTGVVFEDEEDLVLNEYKAYLSFSGQPSMGDAFFEWFFRERWGGGLVQRVPSPPGQSILSTIPPALASFDVDDHKWICIYLRGGGDYIVNAVDSDWANAKAELDSEGVVVLELLA
jgi:hypothetical protein